MATAFDLNALRAQQEAIISKARDFVDKAVESGKTYVETARIRVESESEEFISRAKHFSAKGRTAGSGIETTRNHC